MNPVVVEARLTTRDVMVASIATVLGNRLTPTLLAAGPVLWSVGAVTGSDPVMRFGATLSWLLVLVPAFALLVGMNSAYRPGSGELYEPARWTFTQDAVEIDQAGRSARADWSEFVGWKRAAGRYLLYTGPRRYVVVPAQGLPEVDHASLESLLSERLGARRR